MVFNWLLTPQIHKVTNGYYINHDNLMIASNEDRKKLIFYFIASQTPEKLNPSDHEAFLAEKSFCVDFRSYCISIAIGMYVARKFAQAKSLSSKIFKRPLLNVSLFGAALFTSTVFSYNICHMLFEPTYVTNSELVDELSLKYNFSVFDFALAKKESHLKALVSELASDSAGISSF